MTTQLPIEGVVAPVNAPNWENRTIFTGDNLEVLRRMNTGSVDLVYLDPPFNSNREYSAPIGSLDAVAKFQDAWTLDDVKEHDHEQLRAENPALHDVVLASRLAGGDSTMAYLMMMAARLLELRRVMKPTAAIYLHCDPTASHYLKMVMDVVFGREQFRREIVWSMYQASGFKSQAKNWIRGHDTLLYYAPMEATFNTQYLPYSDDYLSRFKFEDEDGPPVADRRQEAVPVRAGRQNVLRLGRLRKPEWVCLRAGGVSHAETDCAVGADNLRFFQPWRCCA